MKIDYVVDEKNRVVIATVNGVSNAVVNKLHFKSMLSDTDVAIEECKIQDQIKVVAHCHANDKFDANIGIQVARVKLYMKLARLTEKALDRCIKYKLKEIKQLEYLRSGAKSDIEKAIKRYRKIIYQGTGYHY